MSNLGKEVSVLTSLPTQERFQGLQRVLPRAVVDEVLAETGHDRAVCKRLPSWFMVWFVVGVGKLTSLDPGTGSTVRAAWFPT